MKRTALSEKKRRFKPEVRKSQIVEVARQLISDKGLAWTTMNRIAEQLNICKATLYYHYTSRQALLSDIFGEVTKEILEPFHGDSDDIVRFIRNSAQKFFEQTQNDPAQARMFFELLSAPQDENMIGEVQKHLTYLYTTVEAAVREGVRQGVFRENTDVMLVVWQLLALGLATVAGSMQVLPKFVSMEQAMNAVDVVLDSIKKPPKRQPKRK